MEICGSKDSFLGKMKAKSKDLCKLLKIVHNIKVVIIELNIIREHSNIRREFKS